MFSAFINCFKVKELRDRILFTIGIIFLVRLAANIPCPGVDTAALKAYIAQLQQSQSGLVGMIDIFSGGAIVKFAIAALGVMPYISASIIMQLLMPVFPAFEKMQREGESGRQKINQYTRYLTIAICMVQGFAIVGFIANPALNGAKQSLILFPDNPMLFFIPALIILTCGTMIFMWLGEQVTERGIGNGVSIIIAIGILSRLPQAIGTLIKKYQGGDIDMVRIIILSLIFFSVTAATIMLTQGVRKVPIQMIRKSIGGFAQPDATFMPLKVNFAGVMPIIFASTLITVPGLVAQKVSFLSGFAPYFNREHPVYLIMYAAMIILFSYFWVANQFNPMQIADNLKKDGAYIPGIRPGQPTSDFIDGTMTRVTFAGTMMLTFLAIFPMLLSGMLGVDFLVAQFFGGTSLLIMAGVVLDTLSQMESHLTMRNYEGFMKSGKLRSRN